MTWLSIIGSLLFLWVLLALSFVIYSAMMESRRQARAELRGQFQELFLTAASQAGGSELINSNALTAALRPLAAKDRICLRDCLIEQTRSCQNEALQPLRETYEALNFVSEDIQTLIKGRWDQKAEAALRLGRMRCNSAIEVLTGALREQDKDVRMAAVCALAEIGEARSIQSIVYALADADGWQVLQVADKLLLMPVDITRPLLELLQQTGAVRERREAATRMVLEMIADFGQRGNERLGTRAARIAASQYLNSDSIDMRARAIRAFAAVGIENHEELEMLIAKLTDKDWQVRAVAAKALGQLNQELAIPALSHALCDEAWWVRHNAAHALALLGRTGLEQLYAQKLNSDRFAREIAQQVIEELQLDAAVRS